MSLSADQLVGDADADRMRFDQDLTDPASGVGTSSSCSTSGPPVSCSRTAFMSQPPRFEFAAPNCSIAGRRFNGRGR